MLPAVMINNPADVISMSSCFFSPVFNPPFSSDGWDGGRNNFVNGYHDNRITGNSFNRGPPRMERGRGGVGGGGYRGNRGGSFNPINPPQPMAFGGYENKSRV